MHLYRLGELTLYSLTVFLLTESTVIPITLIDPVG